jgi:cytochrome c biogenesis factor
LALPWCFGLTSVALAGLALALVAGDLALRYVAEEITLNMPRVYRAAALSTGSTGRWLLFAWLATACATLAQVGRANRTARSTLVLTAAAMLALMWAAVPTPFERLAFVPLEGMGHAAPLQLPQLVAALLLLLLGYALLVVAIASAVDGAQRRRVARWLIPAWLCLTSALALGAWLLENFILPRWSPDRIASVTPLVWVGVGAALFLPALRQQWWPGRRSMLRVATIVFVLAVLLVVVSGVGRVIATRHDVSLGPGSSTSTRDTYRREWTFAQQGVSPFRVGDTEVLAVTLEGARGSLRVLLVSERRQFIDSRSEEAAGAVVRIGHARGFLQDVTVTLLRMLPNDLAQVRIGFTPFGAWLWPGLVLWLVAGGVAWATALRRRN